MGTNVEPVLLNLGCGTYKRPGWINVDAYKECSPDMILDLNVTPYPWEDNSVDAVLMTHVLEHVENWWGCFTECARILKPGGTLQINVPDESSSTALTYRDHLNVFNLASFHGIKGRMSGTNAWAKSVEGTVPLVLEHYFRVPFKQYEWMTRWCPWLLQFLADHSRNWIWEQQFHFRKV